MENACTTMRCLAVALKLSSKSKETATVVIREREKEEEAPRDTAKTDVDKFREEALVAHNKRRKWHQAPPVKLSDELNSMAQKWAEHLAASGLFEHSTKSHNNGAGENIAAHSNLISGEDVVEMWYSEIKDYNYSNPGFQGGTGHFTQVVWKDCDHIGVGMSSQKGSHGMYCYVANYWPHGNVMGQFEANVLPKF